MSTLHVENLKGLSSGGNANKVIIPSGQTLEVTDKVRHDDMPSGSVVQVVEHVGNGSSSQGYGSSTAYSSTSFVSVDQAALTITPKFATSKILLIISTHIYVTGHSTNDWRGARIRIQRGSTDILTDGNAYGQAMYLVGDSDRWMTHQSNMVYDSPNTTSATTYTLQVSSRVGNAIYLNRGSYGAGGFFLAMEIAQ